MILKNVWYLAEQGKNLAPGGMAKKIIADEPILLMRNKGGQTFAIKDICPHRGIPLSYGWMSGDQVVCPYHGWKFNGHGICTEIPSLVEGQELDPTKIKVKSYPIQEVQGNIWIFIGEKNFDPALAPQPPRLSCFAAEKVPNMIEVAHFPCHIDHAVIGLMDPAHGPYVHRSWFWRSEKSSYEKRKKFAPVEYGFQMVRHQPSKNSKAYILLGGQPTTEITFTLPSVRVEHIKVGDKNFVSYTALTPIDEKNTVIHQMLYWDMPWMTALKPVVRKFAQIFLYQDIDAVTKQQEGLKYDPSLMLIRDSDTQAKWYFGLKESWENHITQTLPFRSPVQETELRWRS